MNPTPIDPQTATAASALPFLKWPDDPYRGLTSYTDSDRALFAARSNDVVQFVTQMTRSNIRVMLLHGETGCGKTSFLNAGVLPDLEERIGSFHVVRDLARDGKYALLVRSTRDPLRMVAYEVYRMVKPDEEAARKQDHKYHSELVEGFDNDREFRQAVYRDPGLLVQALAEISERDSRSIVIGVDQAEEIFTLPGGDGDEPWRMFFSFLALLSKADTSVKLLIAFRTEYHGRFYTSLRQARGGTAQVQNVGDFYLRELGENDLVEVIQHPTSERKIEGLAESPRDHYKFRYENGELIRRIAQRLMGQTNGQSRLPALQIVCRRLYARARREAKEEEIAVIRVRDFEGLGGVTGQIDGHLQQALLETKGIGFVHSGHWRDLLSTLAQGQEGGGVTTNVIGTRRLQDTARQLEIEPATFESGMNALQEEPWRIVRPRQVLDVNTGELIPCYSLGHDVIGFALENWKRLREKHKRWLWALRIIAAIAAAFLLVAFVEQPRQWRYLVLVFVFGALALLQDVKYLRVPYRLTYGAYLDILGLVAVSRISFGRLPRP